MPNVYNWIHLGTVATALDPTEGNSGAENAGSNAFVGQSFGSVATPLYAAITEVTADATGGDPAVLEADNTIASDTLTTDTGAGAVAQVYDGSAIYQATLTYADGSTASVAVRVVQTESGDLFLAPETGAGGATAAFEAAPLQSITLDSLISADPGDYEADRHETGWDDGVIEGTSGADLIDAGYAEPVSAGSDQVDGGDAGLPGRSGDDDDILAGEGNDTVLAGAGDDSVLGGGGEDTLQGGQGDDTLAGGAGNDRVEGGDDADRIVIDQTDGNDQIDGGEGGTDSDTLVLTGATQGVRVDFTGTESGFYGFDGGSFGQFSHIEKVVTTDHNDMVASWMISTGVEAAMGAGDDTFDGGSGNDTVTAGAGNDVLLGGGGENQLYGGAGNDVFHAAAGDRIDGGADSDELRASNVRQVIYDPDDSTKGTLIFADGQTLSFTGIERLVLNGGNPDGIIYGSDGADSIGAGYVDANGDVIDNGDAFLGSQTGDDDGISAGGGNDTVQSLAGHDNVHGGTGDDLIDTGVGNDYAQGNEDNDTLHGGAGDDFLRGDAGNDSVFGEADNDTVYGGAGNDRVYAGDGNDSAYGGYDQDEVYGGAGNDTITGSGGHDQVFGGDGDDLVNGSDGRDTLYGGAGADSLFSDEDADTIYAGSGDLVDGGETTTAGGVDDDTLYLTDVASVHWISDDGENGYVQFNDGTSLEFHNIENLYIDGTRVPGPDGVVQGGAGDDTIDAGYAGDPQGDVVDGADNAAGTDDDLIAADAGNDKVMAGQGDDTVWGGEGDDRIYGGAGGDRLLGGTGADTLEGEAGNDTLIGGTGGDLMQGGADRDLFSGTGIGDSIDGGDSGDDFDRLDLSDWGADHVHVIRDPLNSEDGRVEFLDDNGDVIGELHFTDIEKVVPCFTPGTLILTGQGEVAVESLAPGDLVLTRDNGWQPIRWVGKRRIAPEDLDKLPNFAPVQIRRGALGFGLPERDMMVSPQHRMLFYGARAEMLFGEHEVLVAAVHLLGLEGVSRVVTEGVTYIHLLFDQHEIIRANGAWTESFQPGDMTMAGMDDAPRNELLALFPDLQEVKARYMAARRSLKAHEARVLLRA